MDSPTSPELKTLGDVTMRLESAVLEVKTRLGRVRERDRARFRIRLHTLLPQVLLRLRRGMVPDPAWCLPTGVCSWKRYYLDPCVNARIRKVVAAAGRVSVLSRVIARWSFGCSLRVSSPAGTPGVEEVQNVTAL